MGHKNTLVELEDEVRNIRERSEIKETYLLSLWGNYFSGPTALELEQKHGMTRDDFNVLFTLAATGPLSASKICILTGRPKNSISRAVIKLTNSDHLIREVAAGDRRKAYLRLTGKGLELYHSVLPVYTRRRDEMLAALTPNERRRLNDLLLKAIYSPGNWSRSY